jgi:dihydropteroate synthase
MSEYYRPIPCETGRWRLAGGWLRFSQFELLSRGAAPRIVDRAPDAVLAALTAPRPSLLGLGLDQPRIMGIVNATPDSFSDGGTYDGAAQARLLASDGADILDIGGESTRPGAREVPVADEIARIAPAIAAGRGRRWPWARAWSMTSRGWISTRRLPAWSRMPACLYA